MIRIKRKLVVAVLFLTACERHSGGNEANGAVQPNGNGNAAVGQAQPSPKPGTPAAPAESQPTASVELSDLVLEKQDITVNGEPACALTLRYRGAVEQPVTWRGEGCAKLLIRLSSIEDLKRIGQDTKFNDETLEDLARMPGQRALYVEGGHSSALYLENVMHRIYAVPLADLCAAATFALD